MEQFAGCAGISMVLNWIAVHESRLGGCSIVSRVYSPDCANRSDDARKFITGLLRILDRLLDRQMLKPARRSPDALAQKAIGAMRNLAHERGASPGLLPERFWQVTFQHEGKDGEHFPINWWNESAGTRRFFSVLGPWLELVHSGSVLGPWEALVNKGQVLCVDELETSLHPSLAAELLRLLFKLTERAIAVAVVVHHAQSAVAGHDLVAPRSSLVR